MATTVHSNAGRSVLVGQANCFGRGLTYGWEYGEPFSILAQAGFDCVDLGGLPPGDRKRRLKTAGQRGGLARAAGLKPVCYHSVCLEPWARAERNALAQAPHMQCAAATGISLFLVHHLWVNFSCFNLASSRARARQMRFDVESLTLLGRRALGHGLRLVVENNPYFPPDYYLELIGRLPAELCGSVLDVGHANLQPPSHRMPVVEMIDRLGGRVEHLHLRDNDGIADQHLPVLSGAGTIDWRRVFRALKRSGYKGVLNEELPPMTGIAWTAWSVFTRKAQPLRDLWGKV